jgi:hypothetical protein
MLKNAQSNGYSSKVRGWLVIDGASYDLSQVGPDFCVLREPLLNIHTQAELVVEVDGNHKRTLVQIALSSGQGSRRIAFVRT